LAGAAVAAAGEGSDDSVQGCPHLVGRHWERVPAGVSGQDGWQAIR
jgi:hypothetical protein